MLTIILLSLSTIATTSLLIRTYYSLNLYGARPAARPVADTHPTVSVCIAARNETHALAQCLERVIKSEYPKLEILVLDDSSHDDTSLIIKSFANAGVRFIPGKELAEGWLGKNHAYQTLIDEASGDLLLFIDVDTSLKQTTITQLVTHLTQDRLAMVSVLPRRDDGLRFSSVVGTMRYYWELLLGTKVSPPASSAIWMVSADAFDQEGIAFSNYALSVRPERHLARQIQRSNGYRYIIGTDELGVSYEKHLHSQYETAIRLYYPATGRSTLSWVAWTSYLLLLVAPLLVIISWQWSQLTFTWSLALMAVTAAAFARFVTRTYGPTSRFPRILIGPLLVVQEIVLLGASYVRYRHGSVTWKGRLVNAQPGNHDALTLDN